MYLNEIYEWNKIVYGILKNFIYLDVDKSNKIISLCILLIWY